MKPPVKVQLTTFTCRRCKRTFKSFSNWYEHVRQEHGSVFIKSSGNISSSSENTISLVQYFKTTTEEQTFVESTSSSSLQDDREESLPVMENQTNLSTLPQNEASGATTSQDLDVCEQTSFNKTSATSVASDTNFSSDQGAETPAASGNPNGPSTPSEQAEGNTAAQTSSNQTSETSLESDTNLSSGEGVVTHNPDVNAEASSHPKYEPSASYQQAKNKPAPGLFSWNKESLSREVETLTKNSDTKDELSASSQEAGDKTAAELISFNQEKLLQEMETSIDSKVVDRLFYRFCVLDRLKSNKSSSITLRKIEKPVFDRQNCTLNSLWYHKSDEDAGRFTLEPPPEPIDLSAKLRAITAIKNKRVPQKPRLKELLGSLSLPVFDPSTGTTVLRPSIVEIQSATPYEQQELPPCESPLEMAERIQARRSRSNEWDKEMSTNEDMDETGEGNNTSDKGISVSGEETDETDEASSDLINDTSTPYQQTEDNTASQNSSNQTSWTSPQKSDTNFSSGQGAKTLTASSNTKNEPSTPCEEAGDNTAAQTSSNQTIETSLESDTHFSSDYTAKTLSASSDPKTEPSTPCQQIEDNTAAQTSSNQTILTSLESDTKFSSGQGTKALTASSDPKNEPSTPCEEAGDNTAVQSSSNRTSGISLESDTNFSSGEGALTHNPDVHAETSSTNEPSSSYQHAENKTATGLFSLYKESLSREVETLTASNDPSTPYQEAGDNTVAELISLNQEKLLQEMETLVDRMFDRFCVPDGLEEMSTNEDRTWMRWIREMIFQMKEFLFQAGQILTLASWTDRARRNK